jgi:hypothetical protein
VVVVTAFVVVVVTQAGEQVLVTTGIGDVSSDTLTF